jgi:hypothetical protein
MPTFEVTSYAIEKLTELLATKSQASPDNIKRKAQVSYFEEYFSHLGAKTIVVENQYIDRDYLEDYAAYYVRCFKPYLRYCARLHFFQTEFNEDDLKAALNGDSSTLALLQDEGSYLGFVVVKPLPLTVIGRTCLKTYPEIDGRTFPITQQYESHLFGVPLRVRTLAFQEQDKVAAACATSALWSVFHGTGRAFQHSIPSPIEITKAATAVLPQESRTFPNVDGLNIHEMNHAVKYVGLEPYVVRVEDNEHILKSTLYAYLKGGVPAILSIQLYDVTDPPKPKPIGGHAVAITGFHVSQAVQAFKGFILRASAIDKIYAHDDQVGPFARMEFDGETVALPNKNAMSVSTSYGVTRDRKFRAVPQAVMIPLYHKIRIPFSVVHDTVMPFNAIFRAEWEIYLVTSSSLKESIRNATTAPLNGRSAILTEHMPRFMWRASAWKNDRLMADLLFDATDIEQGQFFCRAVEYDLEAARSLRDTAQHDFIRKMINTYSGESPNNPSHNTSKVLQWFAREPMPSNSA